MVLSPVTLWVFGLAGFVVGLLGWLANRRTAQASVASFAPGLVLLLGLAGSLALVAPDTTDIGYSLIGVAGLSGLLALLHPFIVRIGITLLRTLGNIRVQWLFLFLASPVLAGLFRCAVGPDSLELPPVHCVRPSRLVTDLGAPVVLREIEGKKEPTAEMLHYETKAIQGEELLRRVIQTADATATYNCHGWIFSDGRYLISDTDVERILNHNGYQEVTAPRREDVIVYRDETGFIVHTGIVRDVEPSGVVLVEGKWGWMGRYLHAPEAQAFSKQWSFYRSERKGHLLRQQDGSARP